MRRQVGLTLLELALALVIMGILATALLPTIHSLHHKSLEEEDLKALRTLKEVIIGQFLATGALPACMDGSGNPSNGNCDTQNSLGHLPVRLTDARNGFFKYDVWNVASSNLTSTNHTNVCTTLNTAISTGYQPGYPAICDSTPNYSNPSSPYCLAPRNIAFVLVGSGSNRPGHSGESASSTWTRGTTTCPPNRNIGTNRVFENPSRRPDASCAYDDLVEVVTLHELNAKKCAH